MTDITISPKAGNDLKSIQKYLRHGLQNPPAAKKLVADLLQAIRRLGEYPDCGAMLQEALNSKSEYRYLVCRGYLIFYTHEANRVFIHRVLNGRRSYLRVLFGDVD